MKNEDILKFVVAFIKGNPLLMLQATFLLVALKILNTIPIVGGFFGLIYLLVSTAVQIYIGQLSSKIYFSHEVEKSASKTTLADLFGKYVPQAFAVNFGLLIFMFAILMLFNALLSSVVDTREFYESLMREDLTFLKSIDSDVYTIFALMTSISLWFGYISPAVVGYAFDSSEPKEAFFRSLSIFKPSFWAKTLNMRYFKYVSIWSIIIFLLSLFNLILLSMSIIFIPFAVIITYFMLLYNGVFFIHTKEYLSR
jgi:hypothetical protein